MENFCKFGLMSTCTAKVQKKCEHFRKSSGNPEKCRHFTFGEYCDSLKAQLASQKKQEEEKEEEKEKAESAGIEAMEEAQEAYLEQINSNKKFPPDMGM